MSMELGHENRFETIEPPQKELLRNKGLLWDTKEPASFRGIVSAVAGVVCVSVAMEFAGRTFSLCAICTPDAEDETRQKVTAELETLARDAGLLP